MIKRLGSIRAHEDMHEALEEFMMQVTKRCLTTMEAGVFALVESLPTRLGEDI